MRFSCKIEIELGSPSEAEHALEAIGPDNEGFVKAETRGSTLVAVCGADNPESLRHTVDDLLACLGVALGTGTLIDEEE